MLTCVLSSLAILGMLQQMSASPDLAEPLMEEKSAMEPNFSQLL